MEEGSIEPDGVFAFLETWVGRAAFPCAWSEQRRHQIFDALAECGYRFKIGIAPLALRWIAKLSRIVCSRASIDANESQGAARFNHEALRKSGV